MSVLHTLTQHLWCPWLLGGLSAHRAGLLFWFRGFSFFPRPAVAGTTLGSLFHPTAEKKGGGLSSLQALATALASTMGTGSIAGVAAALCLGGPGAVFWMWVSALLGMMTSCGGKAAVCALPAHSPGGGHQGGPMFYLRDGVGSPCWRSGSLWPVSPATLAGAGWFSQVPSPPPSTGHLAGRPWPSAWAPWLRRDDPYRRTGPHRPGVPGSGPRHGPALSGRRRAGAAAALAAGAPGPLMFRCALTPEAALGGGLGWTAAEALRHGVARGCSPMRRVWAPPPWPTAPPKWITRPSGHVGHLLRCSSPPCSLVPSPPWSFWWGRVPAGDSILPTASGHASPTGPWGSPHCPLLFRRAGGAGAWIVWISLLLFAFSSILGWSYYGQQGLRFLTGGDRLLPCTVLSFGMCHPGACREQRRALAAGGPVQRPDGHSQPAGSASAGSSSPASAAVQQKRFSNKYPGVTCHTGAFASV